MSKTASEFYGFVARGLSPGACNAWPHVNSRLLWLSVTCRRMRMAVTHHVTIIIIQDSAGTMHRPIDQAVYPYMMSSL